MTGDKIQGSGHEPLPPHVADKLLDLLSSDDEFRAQFKKDPAAALARIGHPTAEQYVGRESVSEGETFYCMTSDELASKEEIRQSREELKSFLTSNAAHTVIFCFEAGKTSSTLRSK